MIGRAGSVALLLALSSACTGAQLAWYSRTPDRTGLVQVHQDRQEQWLTLDVRASRRYRFIATEELAFDAAGQRFAFPAQIEQNPERWTVVTDFVEGQPWDGVAALRFGPQGQRLTYAALEGTRWRMVLDGKPGPPFDAIDPTATTFSPNGQRLGYVAQDGPCVRPVIDGQPGSCVARVSGLALADDAHRDVVVLDDEHDGSGAHVVVGGQKVADLPGVGELVVDRAVAHWAAVVPTAPGWQLVVDGAPEQAFDRIDRVVWAPDGRSVAYAAQRARAWHVVMGLNVSPPYTEVEEPVFAARGSRSGYLARGPGRSVVDVDGRVVWESTAPATALTFSEDGARMGWVYWENRSAVVAVDEQRYPFEAAVERTMRFSHDGRHWAMLVGSRTTRQMFVTVDGVVQLPFDTEELFGTPSRDPAARLGAWVSAELERYLAGGREQGT